MIYLKPEVLSVDVALDMIRGIKETNPEVEEPLNISVSAAYELDE